MHYPLAHHANNAVIYRIFAKNEIRVGMVQEPWVHQRRVSRLLWQGGNIINTFGSDSGLILLRLRQACTVTSYARTTVVLPKEKNGSAGRT